MTSEDNFKPRLGYLPPFYDYGKINKDRLVQVFGFSHEEDWGACRPYGMAELYMMGGLIASEYFDDTRKRRLIFRTWERRYNYVKFPDSYIIVSYDAYNKSQKREYLKSIKEALLDKLQ